MDENSTDNNNENPISEILEIIEPRKSKKNGRTVQCDVCKRQVKVSQATHAELVRPSLVREIKKVHEEWTGQSYICQNDLKRFKQEYIEHVIEREKGELSVLDEEVVKSLNEHEILVKKIDEEFEKNLSFAQRLADKFVEFAGSMKFLVAFFIYLLAWVGINIYLLAGGAFDPYPFILLNLTLSCLAAIQAPIILISQSRQAAKDRLRGEYDYKTDLKAELEISNLHEKVDHLIKNQWQRMLEIQQLQLELLHDIHLKKNINHKGQNEAKKDEPKKQVVYADQNKM